MKRLVTTLSILVLFQTVNGQDLFKFTDTLLLKNQIPELGFAVISKDSIIELKTIGYHRTDTKNENTKATLNDYFHLGSNTKAITGFVAAYLVETKKLVGQQNFLTFFRLGKKIVIQHIMKLL